MSCWHCHGLATFDLEELPNIGNRLNSVWEGAKGGTKGGEECDSADNFQLQLRRLGSPPQDAQLFVKTALPIGALHDGWSYIIICSRAPQDCCHISSA